MRRRLSVYPIIFFFFCVILHLRAGIATPFPSFSSVLGKVEIEGTEVSIKGGIVSSKEKETINIRALALTVELRFLTKRTAKDLQVNITNVNGAEASINS